MSLARPDDVERFARMLAGADLAVDVAHQGRGVGRELIRVTREAAPEAKSVLLAAPAAVDHHPHLGFTRHESAWTPDRLQ
ncbi:MULTISPECIES: hypothetical protein [unclassified Streptomyces]|uniref:hypothetical protein n=1 Tax=unclassified Streptomyces TaxID=2593676 RepID=UPI002E2C2F20|nr:hypothetical protein [Streptomyces sp. NBC_00273]